MASYILRMSDQNVIYGRPDFANHGFGVTLAKKFPPYVFSIGANACLVHKVKRVEIRWWQVAGHGEKLVKLTKPRMIAILACGEFRFLASDRTRTCMVPNPDAILCGRCHGELAPFGKHGTARKAGITVQQAHVKLGCVVKGY